MQPRFHRVDAWRGYRVPALAIIGASDTGTASDSPANSNSVLGEIRRFRREVLRPAGIQSRLRWGATSNIFCGKRWLTVAREDFPKAAQLAADWLQQHDSELRYLHDADLAKVGIKPSGVAQ